MPATSFPPPDQGAASWPAAPFLLTSPDALPRTGLVVIPQPDALPVTGWAGPLPAAGLDPVAVAAAADPGWRCPPLPEAAAGWFGRPGLSGCRLDSHGGGPAAGRDWSPRFTLVRAEHGGASARTEGVDEVAGLRLVTEFEAVPGGTIRGRHTLTNTAPGPYLVNALELVFPLPAQATEILDFTGRQLLERVPQRHRVADGLWLREGRRGRPGHDSPTVLVAGTAGFGFGAGEVWGLHVAWSGNTVHFTERLPSGMTTIGGGELLLPGEIVLAEGESYATPWVYLAAAEGLDELAAQFHGYLRSLPAHPATPRPVNLNVWEAVYFEHNLAKLTSLADIAASLGVERFVLDDGWFRGRRHDHAGLGDWQVDEEVWPGGLHALIKHVRIRGMAFGLWIEPEMVNPDSALYRAHPDWILATGGRVPPLQRNQLVLDLTRGEVASYLLEQISSLLAEYEISYVKWDHNRSLVDAGSAARAGAPAVHGQTLAVYALLDELRRRHPQVEWESCASGGGRVDLAILERAERIWVSDMTDALARQVIQRWTGQLVPPEYCGAHVSAPVSHQTGRSLPLAMRAATALFGHFGIEWDLTTASPADLAELAGWIRLYQEQRALIHSGTVLRLDAGGGPPGGGSGGGGAAGGSPAGQPAFMYGVLAQDRAAALLSYVQLDQSPHTQAVALRVRGLDPGRSYRVTEVTPEASRPGRRALLSAEPVPGAVLSQIGIALPVQRPYTAVMLHLEAARPAR